MILIQKLRFNPVHLQNILNKYLLEINHILPVVYPFILQLKR